MDTNEDFKRARRINHTSFKQYRPSVTLTDVEKQAIKPKYPLDELEESCYDDYSDEVINILDLL